MTVKIFIGISPSKRTLSMRNLKKETNKQIGFQLHGKNMGVTGAFY